MARRGGEFVNESPVNNRTLAQDAEIAGIVTPLKAEIVKLRAALQDIEAVAEREDHYISPAAAEMSCIASKALQS